MVSASQLWTQYAHPPQLEVCIKTNAPLKLLLWEFFITKEERSQQRSHEFSAQVYCVVWSLNKRPSVSIWWKHSCRVVHSVQVTICHHSSGTYDAVEVRVRLIPKPLDFGLEWISTKISTLKKTLSIQAAWPGSFYTQL